MRCERHCVHNIGGCGYWDKSVDKLQIKPNNSEGLTVISLMLLAIISGEPVKERFFDKEPYLNPHALTQFFGGWKYGGVTTSEIVVEGKAENFWGEPMVAWIQRPRQLLLVQTHWDYAKRRPCTRGSGKSRRECIIGQSNDCVYFNDAV